MVLSIKIFKYFLILTLFNLNIFFIFDESINEEIISISGNNISNISLNQNEKKVLDFEYNKDDNNRINYISLFPFGKITIESEIDGLNHIEIEKLVYLEVNSSNFNKEKLRINIISNNNSEIEIINIAKDNFSSYINIDAEDNKKVNIENKFNFVRFLKKEEKKIKFKINFEKKINVNISYGIVLLRSKNSNYIPRAYNFKEITTIKLNNKKDYELENEINNKYEENVENSQYPALIVSLLTKDEIKYSVTINHDLMNAFLIGSICIALVFAAITFFLIRRKSSIGTKATEDPFDDKNGEEKEN